MSDVHAGVRWSLGGAERKVVQSVFYFFLKMTESHQGGANRDSDCRKPL